MNRTTSNNSYLIAFATFGMVIIISALVFSLGWDVHTGLHSGYGILGALVPAALILAAFIAGFYACNGMANEDFDALIAEANAAIEHKHAIIRRLKKDSHEMANYVAVLQAVNGTLTKRCDLMRADIKAASQATA